MFFSLRNLALGVVSLAVAMTVDCRSVRGQTCWVAPECDSVYVKRIGTTFQGTCWASENRCLLRKLLQPDSQQVSSNPSKWSNDEWDEIQEWIHSSPGKRKVFLNHKPIKEILKKALAGAWFDGT